MPVVIVLAIVVILAGVFLVATGRGGELAYEHADHAPLDLGPVSATDVALLRPPTAMWGYNMQVTDEALDQIARAMRQRDVQIASLQRQLAELASAARDEPAGDQGADHQAVGRDGYPPSHAGSAGLAGPVPASDHAADQEIAVPGQASGSQAPGGQVSRGNASGDHAPDSWGPGSQAPDSWGPGSQAPGSWGPGGQAADSRGGDQAPGSRGPGGQAADSRGGDQAPGSRGPGDHAPGSRGLGGQAPGGPRSAAIGRAGATGSAGAPRSAVDDGLPSQDENGPALDERRPHQDERLPLQDERLPLQDERLPLQDERRPLQNESGPPRGGAVSSPEKGLPSGGNVPLGGIVPSGQVEDQPSRDEDSFAAAEEQNW